MKNKEFSKVLLTQESILVWLATLSFIVLAFLCVYMEYIGSLPYVTTLIGAIWGAYGVSQACYYSKSKAENTVNGIKYETALRALSETASEEPVLDYYYSDIEDPDTYQI